MAFDTISSPSSSTGTTFGGNATQKISDFLNGGGSEVANIYDDDLLIVDPAATTKKARFDCGSITAGQTRVMTLPDKDITVSTVIGTQEIYFPAQSLKPRATNGAALTDRTQATSNYEQSTMNFDTSTQEYAQLPPIALPANYDNGTIKFKLYWTCTGGSASQTIDFDMSGYAYSNDVALTTAFSGTQNVTDTWIADNDLHITSYSSSITIGGTPADDDLIILELTRDVAADDLGVDAEIIGVKIELTLDDGTSS